MKILEKVAHPDFRALKSDKNHLLHDISDSFFRIKPKELLHK